MVVSNGAKVIEAEELKEIINESSSNPTVDRLMFLEAKSSKTGESKVFPCLVEAFGVEENAEVKSDPGLRFKMVIFQSMNGEFSMVRVIVLANELGVTKRIWDKPPAKWLRDETPFAAVEDKIQ